jgi:hypothetical protein
VTHVPLPAAVERFLRQQIVSFERLGVLLLMRRHTSRWWSAHTVALELEMPVEAAQAHLEHLGTCNLVAVRVAESVLYRYEPGTDELAQVVERVADAHYHQRDAMAKVLALAPSEGIRLFADAFRLRRGPRDG